jgi:hypothetical protein
MTRGEMGEYIAVDSQKRDLAALKGCGVVVTEGLLIGSP